MAEYLLRAAVPGLAVSSAGTGALVGEPMQPFALSTLAARGLDGSGFRARQLTADIVIEQDLVLTATRAHRAAVVTLVPRSAASTFTIREFDRLLSLVPEAAPVDVVAAARAQRGYALAERPDDDDVSDPYRGPEAGFVACAGLIERSLARLVALLAPAPA
jgi:protein-tyrosine phosphatase